MFPAIALVSVTLAAAGQVDIRSSGRCPSADDVLARLQPILPEARDKTARHVATVDVIDDGPEGTTLHLLLVRADASVIGDRQVRLQKSCEDMALTAATILAAWESDPAAPGPLAVDDGLPPTPGPERAPIAVEAGLGGGAALVGGVAAVAAAEARFGFHESRWQARLGASMESARTADLPPGSVDWQHTTFALGLVLRSVKSRWLFGADAGPVLGFMTLQSTGLGPVVTRRSFEYGATMGLRFGHHLGRATVWAEGRTNLWAQGQRISITGTSTGRDLPSVELALSLGLSLRIAP